MLRGDLIYWLGWLGVIVVNFGAIYLAWWALFKDKSRGRRRCPRCWYDLSYSPGSTCAECGFVGTDEKVFFKTRRRYKVAVLAILICVALATYVNETAIQGGWQTVAPTRVLLFAMSVYEDDRNETFAEVIKRMNQKELSEGDWNALADRVVTGDWRAPAGTLDWAEKYGDLAAIMRQHFYSSRERGTLVEMEVRLLETEPLLTMDSRTTWPTGTRPRIRLQMRDWWPAGTQSRLTITPSDETVDPVTVYHNGRRQPWAGFTFTGPTLEGGVNRMTFDVEIAQRVEEDIGAPMDGQGRVLDLDLAGAIEDLHEWRTVATQEVTLEITGRGTIEDALEPFDDADEELRRAVRSVFAPGVVRWTDGPSHVRNYCHTPHTHRPEFDDVAVGVTVEVLFEGEPARQLDIWWLAGQFSGDHKLGWEAVMEDAPVLDEVEPDDDRWSLRITGKRELALRAGDAKYYWDGQIEMPLRVDIQRRSAPPTAWWTDDPRDLEDSGEDE